MHALLEGLFERYSVNDEQHLHAAHYVFYVMAIVTLALCFCWLVSCCFCCFPRRLSRLLGALAGLMALATLLAAFIMTDKLEHTAHTGQRVARKSLRLIEILTADDAVR